MRGHVKRIYNKLDKDDASYILAKSMYNDDYQDVFDEIIKKSKNKTFLYLGKCFCKHLITKSYGVHVNNEYRSYDSFYEELRKIPNPFEEVKASIFSGSFGYDKKTGAYLPWRYEKIVPKKLEDYYKQKYYTDIEITWEKIRCNLLTEDKERPSLIIDNADSHTYFMQDNNDKEIKIGVSKAPYKRKKQLEGELKTQIGILSIIDSGGYDLEAELHEKFKHLNIRNSPKGREWFQPEEELYKFINEHNNRKRNLRIA